MSLHVSEHVLRAFTEGNLHPEEAVEVAEHLDHCSVCATRSVAMEPLRGVFAVIDDPVVPPDLPGEILRAHEAHVSWNREDLLVGSVLLGLGSALFLGLNHPGALLSEGVFIVSSLLAVLTVLYGAFASSAVSLGSLMLAATVSLAVGAGVSRASARGG